MNWKNVETWKEAAKTVADLIEENERLRWVEQQLPIYRQELTERSAQLVRAIRLLQEEGINFEMEEARAKAHASGDLAELLSDEYYAKLDSDFKKEVYNILYEDPSNHADDETLCLIKILAKGER